MSGGRELPLNWSISGEDGDSPSYTDTESQQTSVLKLMKTSSSCVFEEKLQ